MDWVCDLNPVCFYLSWISLVMVWNVCLCEGLEGCRVAVFCQTEDIYLPREWESVYVIMTRPWVKLISGQVWNTNLLDLLHLQIHTHTKTTVTHKSAQQRALRVIHSHMKKKGRSLSVPEHAVNHCGITVMWMTTAWSKSIQNKLKS